MSKKFGLIFVVVMLVMAFSMATFAANENHIYLKGMTLKANQTVEVPYGLSKKAYQANEEGSYIVAFNGPVKEDMKEQVVNSGAKIVEYIPDFSFLALMTPEVAETVKALGCVEDVIIYQPAFKVHPALKDEFGNINAFAEVTVRIRTFADDASVLDNEIVNAHGQKVDQSKGMAVVKVHSSQLVKFAHSNNVKFIELKPEFKLYNDVAKGIMDVDDIWNQTGYKGAGQIVGIADTGLDTGKNDSTMHLDFQGRIVALIALGRTRPKADASDPAGHGTHVAGSVLGNGARSNGQITGMAPEAQVVFQSVMDRMGGLGGLPSDLNTLFAEAWSYGARIHTNSWGAAVNGDYNTDSQNVDEYIWNNDMTVLFAAGNEGADANWNFPIYNTISAPGTAKNCITVGATENYRPTMPMTIVGNLGDDINEIAAFSSRGTTEDGRVKPDICAPGTWILSTKSSLAAIDNFWAAYDTYYAYMGGTSMATPLTAGAVAVARQYMQTQWSHTPSPAMMKAALINGAVDMGFGVPSNDQGWGRLSLVDSLSSKEYRFEDENYSLATSQAQTFAYNVASSNLPLRVTLVWTDYPGSTSASVALVNDLDLKITSPSGVVYYGNDFTSPFNTAYDRLNNVENVWISNPEVGTYTVEVIGYNVPQGPQPFALFLSADF